jgi:hypothetical protein
MLARPIPAPAPVMMATFPFKRSMVSPIVQRIEY